jgi:putative lipase involved disintegration of autophagic bodies
METLSFVLGIAFIVVIALAVVATYAFVKVIKMQNSIEELMRETDQRFADVWQGISEENRHCHSRIDMFEKDIYSQLDSRLDKLETKLTNNKK